MWEQHTHALYTNAMIRKKNTINRNQDCKVATILSY